MKSSFETAYVTRTIETRPMLIRSDTLGNDLKTAKGHRRKKTFSEAHWDYHPDVHSGQKMHERGVKVNLG